MYSLQDSISPAIMLCFFHSAVILECFKVSTSTIISLTIKMQLKFEPVREKTNNLGSDQV